MSQTPGTFLNALPVLTIGRALVGANAATASPPR